MTDAAIAIERVETIAPVLDAQMRLYLHIVIAEAKNMQVVRELCAGNIDITEGEKQ